MLLLPATTWIELTPKKSLNVWRPVWSMIAISFRGSTAWVPVICQLILQVIYGDEWQTNELDYENPFHHPAIVSVIRTKFFHKNSPTSFGRKHSAFFVSAHQTRLEPELPDAMVALVATAVCDVFFTCTVLTVRHFVRFIVRYLNGKTVNARMCSSRKLPSRIFIKTTLIRWHTSGSYIPTDAIA